MAIRKVDGRRFLDSGSIIVVGDAVIEILFKHRNRDHEVALKFRSDDSGSRVRYGNPKPDRTVVHLANFSIDEPQSSGGVYIGKIGDDDLWLAFVAQPVTSYGARWVTYTLYAGGPNA